MTVRQTARQKFANWRIDNDGLLRVTARILPEGCFPYLPEESPDGAEVGPDGYVMQYIPDMEFTDRALRSLEGKPLIVGNHDWRNSENTNSDGLTVGSVAGTPHVEGGCIYADLLITDKEAAEAVQNGKLVEVSAAYSGTCEHCPGTYQGVGYSAVQHDFKFNHVLLLPEGGARCGSATRIINQKAGEEKPMGKTLQRQIGNSSKSYVFQNEDDAREAERMSEDQAVFNGKELEDALAKAKEIQGQIDALNAEREDAMKVIEAQRAQIDSLMSAESQDSMAQEAVAQTNSEDAILEEAVENEAIEEEEKEEIVNKISNAKTFAERRRVLVQNMMPNATADKWTQEQVDGAFTVMAIRATNSKDRTVKMQNKSPMGGRTAPSGTNAPLSALSRIYNSRRETRGGKE